MRDDEIRRILTDANPWWRAAAAGTDPTVWTVDHRLLRDRSTHDLGFRPHVLDDIATGPVTDQLVVLTGPRRIGKSVTLIDTAAALCGRDDVDPRQIIHFPCDGMRDRDLRRALTLGRELTRSVDSDRPRPRVWLLDEVSGVPGWSSVLKAARDGTAVGDETVVATGSRWAGKEDIEGNLMAGRAGSGPGRRRRLLLPMSFRDYIAATRPELQRFSTIDPSRLQEPGVAAELDKVAFDVDAYDLAWQAYLTCGGFPRAVAEHSRTGEVSIGYMRDLAAWLRRDVDPDAAPESLPRLLDALAHRASSPLNIGSTSGDLGYHSREALDLRIRRLIASQAAVTCSRRKGDRLVPGTQAKLYLTDPVLAWLPSRLRAGLEPPDMTRLTETTLGVGLARAIDDLDEGRWVSGDTIGYTRTTSDKEIDFAPVSIPSAEGASSTVPLESKWVDQGWRGEARTIDGKYGSGILATKTILDTSHRVWAVPAPLLSLLLL
ncbi:AAA family ATPase [Actinoplanes sp. NPDC051494]|uniref:AAA family ATPase n=1 Tax=Actinoplanes sp. NPDC051494 TaxID=3363907 RepID=UPI0037B3C635